MRRSTACSLPIRSRTAADTPAVEGMSRTAVPRIHRVWYGGSRWWWLLAPLSWIFAAVVTIRRGLYRWRILASGKPDVPVIVVGNLTAGGTGKTPVTIWLAERLQQEGFKPGIVTRGYRGAVGPKPVAATADSDPAIVGDEAIVLARRTGCVVCVHPDRRAAAELAAAQGVDTLVSDDGLQHYALARDFEIAIVDGARGFGNLRYLPAGPMREPVSRLAEVDAVLLHRHGEGGDDVPGRRRSSDRKALRFSLELRSVSRIDGAEQKPIGDLAGKRMHAIAAIGNPERFFVALESYGIDVIRHPLPDHAEITHADLDYDDELDVIMTEKDAAKCRWLDTSNCWVVPVEVVFDDQDGERLLESLLLEIGDAPVSAQA